MRRLAALFLVVSLLCGASPAPRAEDVSASLSDGRFSADAGPSGMDGLTASAGGTLAAVPGTAGGKRLVRLSGVRPDVLPYGRQGFYLQLPEGFEHNASGRAVEIAVTARRAPGARNAAFAVSYATNEVGNSGWQRFELSDELAEYTFRYPVPDLVAGLGDIIQILPDPDGTGGAVDIASLTATVIPRGGASPAPAPPPAKPDDPAAPEPPVQADGPAVISTAYYDLDRRQVALPERGLRGGLARLGEGVLVATRSGRLFYVSNIDSGQDAGVVELDSHPPFDPGGLRQKQYSDNTLTILGVGAEASSPSDRDLWDVYVSMPDLDADRDCVSVVVWRARFRLQPDAPPKSEGGWARFFRTEPCLPPPESKAGLTEAGGRIDFDKAGVILTVGLGSDILQTAGQYTEDPMRSLAQLESSDYGKVIRIDRATGRAAHISRGHRNPQGLFVDADGTIFETEHGPQGGDEVNIIRPGMNYGWPAVTFGTQYGKKEWIHSPPEASAGRFTLPLFAFLPSIGISEIIRIRGDHFPRWKGDLLVASLTGYSSGKPEKGMRLFRLHYEDGRVLLSEPIYIGDRMRDLLETASGRLVVLGDGDRLLILSDANAARAPRSGSAGAGGSGHAPRSGRDLFEERCSACHALQAGDQGRLGPSLRCVTGRPVASAGGFEYSGALMKKSALAWSADNLAAFMSGPDNWAPGTTMPSPALDAPEIQAIIHFLSQNDGAGCP